ncbi:MAG: ribonuclease HII [Candidatus Giovannonibacteria bacterium]|nr:MAG: ribonuclease HII [Candidatus Giovannonibacteria bacterium]
MAKKYIIGVDEVGRGPLAGPLTVAAILKWGRINFRGIKDSKKLSAKQREKWLFKIKNQKLKTESFEIAVASVGAQIIDKIGITAAARVAVGRSLRKFKIKNSNFKILLDGSLYAPRTYLNQETIIRGDEKIPLIAAASIIAKTHRDKKMTKLHEQFPQYRFDLHKGYGTKLHRSLVKKHGLSDIHRRTFCTKFI